MASDRTFAVAFRAAQIVGRPPASFDDDPTTGYPMLVWDPPLTSTEQAIVDDLVLMARFGITNDLTLAEFRAIKPQLAEIRTFRTRSLSDWNGLTAAQREADEIAWLRDLTDVLRALLRA